MKKWIIGRAQGQALQQFRAVIFDLNGVIVDDSSFHARAWLEFCEARGMKLTEEEFAVHIMGRPNSEIFRYVFKSDLSDREIEILAEEKEARYRRLYEPHRSLVPGVRTLLEDLQRKQIPIALATSSPRTNLPFILDDMDLRKFFLTLVDAEDVKKGKPDPEVYLTAAHGLGINPSECLVFEDSIFGVEAAVAAGMKVIGISTTHGAFGAMVPVAADFSELRLLEDADT